MLLFLLVLLERFHVDGIGLLPCNSPSASKVIFPLLDALCFYFAHLFSDAVRTVSFDMLIFSLSYHVLFLYVTESIRALTDRFLEGQCP